MEPIVLHSLKFHSWAKCYLKFALWPQSGFIEDIVQLIEFQREASYAARVPLNLLLGTFPPASTQSKAGPYGEHFL